MLMLRVVKQPLWPDELFSLAMATGHSLEHPAAQADPSRGDYTEAPVPLPASEYRRYLDWGQPAAGPDRVLRAVMMSDTSPPLYYLLLSLWTRLFGTSDASLRLVSILCALACFPIVGLLARQMGGLPAVVPTCVLFFLAPVALYYATEGRMYSLLWLTAVSSAWLALELRREPRPYVVAFWIVTGAAGLLTHYFYGFVWLALSGWLLLNPGRLPRRVLCASCVATALLVIPWYVVVPRSLVGWRVTGDWLYLESGISRREALVKLPMSYISASGVWGIHGRADILASLVFVGLAGVLCWKYSYRLLVGGRGLLWLWLLAALSGPLAFDLLRGTHTMAIPRYALAGMPAVMLLAGLALSQLPLLVRGGLLLVVVVAWSPGIGDIIAHRYPGKAFREAAQLIDRDAQAGDVLIVHSIPSGVLGVARYLEGDTPIISWVGQLQGRRVPEDLEALTAGYRRVILLKLHEVAAPAPEEAWLRQHAVVVKDILIGEARLSYFVPGGGELSFPSLKSDASVSQE
jgi:mannosyltransferase